MIDVIRDRAERHHQRYRTFDLAAFMRWAGHQSTDWLQWATGQSISTLNRQRRWETWATIQNAGRVQYTQEPVEDGPR